jgi:hypothetical protein
MAFHRFIVFSPRWLFVMLAAAWIIGWSAVALGFGDLFGP